MKPNQIKAFLFPYRTHLETEVEYLRGQLSQRQRRIDEMWAHINAPKTKEPRREPKPLPPIKGVGWDDYRASRRLDGDTEDSADAGSENKALNSGTAAYEATYARTS